MTAQPRQEGDLILYRMADDAARVEVLYAAGELTREATVRRLRRVQRAGSREVRREIEFYDLDAISSLGYRVNSAQATLFRIWATQVARRLAEQQYDRFRVRQDRAFESDFEAEVKRIAKPPRKPKESP